MPAMKKWSELRKEADAAAPLKTGYRELPEDTYTFIIKDPGAVMQTKNGDDTIRINPAVDGGEYDGLRVFHNFNLPDDPSVMKIVFDQFNALGLGEEFFDKDPQLEQVAQSLAGRRFVAKVVKTPDKNDPNKKWTNLKMFQPATGGPVGGNGPGNPGAAGPGTLSPQQTGIPAAPQGAQPQTWGQPQMPQQGYQPQPQQQQAPQQPAGYPDPWAAAPQQHQPQQPQQPQYAPPVPGNNGIPTAPPL